MASEEPEKDLAAPQATSLFLPFQRYERQEIGDFESVWIRSGVSRVRRWEQSDVQIGFLARIACGCGCACLIGTVVGFSSQSFSRLSCDAISMHAQLAVRTDERLFVWVERRLAYTYRLERLQIR